MIAIWLQLPSSSSHKNKELIAASDQESVVLAAEVEKLGHCLHRAYNFTEFSCRSCARQVVRVAQSCAKFVGEEYCVTSPKSVCVGGYPVH